MSKYEIGKKRFRDIFGENSEQIIKNFEKISPDFTRYMVEFAYGELFTREVLSDKIRELAVVANLIGQGNTGTPLRSHIQGMLNVGWSKKEIIELIIFLIGYVGFPSTVDAIKIAHEVFSEEKNA